MDHTVRLPVATCNNEAPKYNMIMTHAVFNQLSAGDYLDLMVSQTKVKQVHLLKYSNIALQMKSLL